MKRPQRGVQVSCFFLFFGGGGGGVYVARAACTIPVEVAADKVVDLLLLDGM
jgi:hypothetical protein